MSTNRRGEIQLRDYIQQKVAVALSGGVDSAVAALLLKKQGYKVFGVHMTNWDKQVNESVIDSDAECETQRDDSKFAQEVAEALNIPIYFYNFTAEYWSAVFKPYISQFERNLIGNPDLMCNSKIKFGVLLETVKKEFGSEVKLATGHYARILEKDGVYNLGTCKNCTKDQTYFLSRLTQAQLREILFPLSDFETKAEVRKFAREQGLPNWDRKSSAGICFIGRRDFASFISSYVKGMAGNILDIEKSNRVGKHKGLCYYSINQRKGVSLSGNRERYYVCGREDKNSTLYVCRESLRAKYLIKESCIVNDLHWIDDSPRRGERVFLKFKHSSLFLSGKIENIDNYSVHLSHQASCASTPGQYVVFYSLDKSRCLGSGVYVRAI